VDCHVRIRELRELSSGDIASWGHLEDRALEPNAYLSSRFVVPAIRHLDPDGRVLVFLVERRARAMAELVGLALLCQASPTRRFPLPHLRGYASHHSFLGGILLDRSHAEVALDALLSQLRRSSWRWHGVVVDRTWGDGSQADLLRRCSETSRITLQQLDVAARAVLRLPVDAEAHFATLSAKLRSNIKRCMRQLREQGQVAWRTVPPGEVSESTVEEFLSLEHLGWKGDDGTSLRSAPAHERFFKDVVQRFSDHGRALFTRLELDGRIIAATSNFVSGDAAFAFKVAYAPQYARVSPGVLCEAEFLRAAGGLCSQLTYVDSGAAPGSYIDRIWPDRRTVQTTCLAISPLGKAVARAIDVVRHRRAHRVSFEKK
jgi:CelD/BcsL family acetyltransferase involved in cellulose biosynthesis